METVDTQMQVIDIESQALDMQMQSVDIQTQSIDIQTQLTTYSTESWMLSFKKVFPWQSSENMALDSFNCFTDTNNSCVLKTELF